MGRLPVDHLPGRRRGRDRQPQRAARDPQLPEVVAAVLANFPERAVIDGEIVIADTTRNTLDFEALQQRIHPAASRVTLLAEQTPASFIAFDLLAVDDTDLTEEPLIKRREALERVLANAAPPIHITPATRDIGDGSAMVRVVRGRRAGRVDREAAGPDLPAGQARDEQDQTRAHRRLRDRRLPSPQVRPGRDRIAAARPFVMIDFEGTAPAGAGLLRSPPAPCICRAAPSLTGRAFN